MEALRMTGAPAIERNPVRDYRLVIFDMDGTLTEELLDFTAIRREVGVSDGVGLLEHMANLSGPSRTRAHDILHRHEMSAAESCVLHAGAHEVLAALAERGIHRALLTRNSAACARRVIERHALVLDHISTREDLPHKPHGDSILNIVRRFGALVEQTLMVGDYLYDLQAAHAAGTDSALLWMKPEAPPDFAAMATYTLSGLQDVLALVSNRSPR